MLNPDEALSISGKVTSRPTCIGYTAIIGDSRPPREPHPIGLRVQKDPRRAPYALLQRLQEQLQYSQLAWLLLVMKTR